MIKISILKKNNNIEEVIVDGHSSYSEYGQNIVCASISVLTISIINGLTEICKIKKLKIQEKDGFIKLQIPKKISEAEKKLINLFLETLILSFKQIKNEYPQEIDLNIKEITNA